jgi:type II secretory pathway pseudopilin PulG
MKLQKQAFSFIELLITVSIIVLLTIIWLSVNTSYTIKANNSRITADLDTAYNALVTHSQTEWNLPLPGGNKNYFTSTGSYTHSWTDTSTYWVYGSLTEHTLSKKYLDSIPKDNNTNNYLAYGITRPDLNPDIANQFEISAIIQDGNSYRSIVKWNYTGKGSQFYIIK